MFQRLLIVVIIIVTCTTINAQNIIKGQLPDQPGSDVIIYSYADYISQKKLIAGTTHTDQAGNFTIRINAANQQLSITAGKKALEFFVMQDGVYEIQNNGNYLQVADQKGVPVNKILFEVDSILTKDWYHLFIDFASGNYKTDYNTDSVLIKLDQCADHFNFVKNKQLKTWLDYKFITARGVFIQQRAIKIGDEEAKKRFNQFEDEYFNKRPVAYNNPFFINALTGCFWARHNTYVYRRIADNKDVSYWRRVVMECRYFKNNELQELAIVNGIKELYKNKFHGEKSEEMEKQIGQFSDSLKNTYSKEILANVIAEYKKNKIGNVFPAITLLNESGKPASLIDIKADYILIDFWATWCSPCREHMAKFPGLMKKYGDKLMIVSISVDDSLSTMKSFLDKSGYTGQWTTIHNGKSGNYYNQVRIDGYPTYFILNKEKKIIAIPFFDNVIKELEKIISTKL